jgi:hypothetical protein
MQAQYPEARRRLAHVQDVARLEIGSLARQCVVIKPSKALPILIGVSNLTQTL